MRYPYSCYTHGDFEIEAPIKDGPPSTVFCPVCHEESMRVWQTHPDIWNTDGAHKTDYDARGDKLERLNRNWSKKYGEKPPPAAKDVPRNSRDPY